MSFVSATEIRKIAASFFLSLAALLGTLYAVDAIAPLGDSTVRRVAIAALGAAVVTAVVARKRGAR